MPLPDPIIEVLATFRPLFTAPTWRKLMILLAGTLVTHGRRTVAAAPRHTALDQTTVCLALCVCAGHHGNPGQTPQDGRDVGASNDEGGAPLVPHPADRSRCWAIPPTASWNWACSVKSSR